MTKQQTLVERLRYGEACEGNQCRVRNAENGCICAEAATAIDLAQTEIKGHMRVEDELKVRIAVLEKALRIIERWSEFPATGGFYESGAPVSYGVAYGSNGERDYMRSIAKEALKDRA